MFTPSHIESREKNFYFSHFQEKIPIACKGRRRRKIPEITYNKTETKHNNKKSRRRPRSKSDFFFLLLFLTMKQVLCAPAHAPKKKSPFRVLERLHVCSSLQNVTVRRYLRIVYVKWRFVFHSKHDFLYVCDCFCGRPGWWFWEWMKVFKYKRRMSLLYLGSFG